MRRQFARRGVVQNWLLLLATGLVMPVASCSDAPASFHTLSATACTTPAKAGYSGSLAKDWATFEPYVRACPLVDSGHASARIWLLTVFAQLYLDSHPDQPSWPDFPDPVLVTADGHCLARLPELFPFDEPRMLTLRYGPAVDGRPGEIRVHVNNPAAGGDYDLPVLKWNQQHHDYVAQNDTDEYKKDDMTCRN